MFAGALLERFASAWYERGMLALGREDFAAARRDLGRYLQLESNGAQARDAREILRSLGPQR
ncbi:MAG: hypothetical protein ABI779_25275 [Acidobacteriota bacterium]